MKSQQIKAFYEFGKLRLDVQNRLLWRGDKTFSLTLKEFEVLFFLIENAGRVVEKDALLNAVWKDTFVEEATLMQSISRVRKKLEAATGSEEEFIETLPKRGYRFLPAVTQTDDDVLVIEEETTTRSDEKISALPSSITRGRFIESGEGKLETENSLILTTASDLLPAVGTKNRFTYLWFVLGFLGLAAIIVMAYRVYIYKPESKAISVVKITPFSGLSGRENQPAFSPDGKQIAFTWNGGEKGSNADIYIKLIGVGEPVRLTDNSADEVSPAFAPDGKTIAFVRVLSTHDEVFLIPALGGAERKICDLRRSFSTISFSPDGLYLAVHDDKGEGRAGIFLVNVETGEKKRLTIPQDFVADYQPAFSPDGQSIAFIRNFYQNVHEIFTVPVTGGEPKQQTFDKVWIGGIAWSADGGRIFFTSQRKYNGRINLWQIAVSGNDQPEVIAISGDRLGSVAVSPDKKVIAFVEELYHTNIWHIESSKVPEKKALHKFAPSSFSDNSPNISPDGRQVVFASDRTGKYEIWIADADGSNVRQLTDIKKSMAGSPRFSPDGKLIVFDAQIEGRSSIYIITTNGGSLRRITDPATSDYMPSWSADGKSIYFASNRNGKMQIYTTPATGGEARQITQNGGVDSYASPDGKYLYYRKGEGSANLWRVPSEGGDEQSLPELAQAGYWRSWTITKTGIYFIHHSENAPYKMMQYGFASERSTEIATLDAPPIWTYPGLSISEDGRTILYAQSGQDKSIIMLAEIRN